RGALGALERREQRAEEASRRLVADGALLEARRRGRAARWGGDVARDERVARVEVRERPAARSIPARMDLARVDEADGAGLGRHERTVAAEDVRTRLDEADRERVVDVREERREVARAEPLEILQIGAAAVDRAARRGLG